MPKIATKAAGNVFYKTRIAASTWNDILASREGAAESTGLDRTRIAYIELGTINPHPEEVLILADTYNAPELHNHFCSRLCPLGRKTVSPIELYELEGSTLKLLDAFFDLDIPSLMKDLVKIGAHGVTEERRPHIENILQKLDEAADTIKALKLCFQKHCCDRTN